MQNFQLLSAILRGAWFIDRAYADSFMPLVVQLLQSNPELKENGKEKEAKVTLNVAPHAVCVDSALSAAGTRTLQRHSIYDDAPAGSVAVIPIKGALMREDGFCGEPGMATIAKWVKEADAHPNIAAIVYDMNTGGGTVDYADVLHNTIKSTSKKSVSWTNGMICSAGYMQACATSKIVIGSDMAILGSIGTMITINDYSKYLAKLGIEVHEIRADDSEDKNEAFYKAAKGDYGPIRKEMLNPMNDNFKAMVTEGRPGLETDKKSENYTLSGRLFVGRNNIKVGLADEFGDLDFAIQLALDLANGDTSEESTTKSNSTSTINMKKFFQEAWTFTIAALGIPAADAKTTEVTQDHFDSLVQKFEQSQKELTAAQTDLTTANEALQTEKTAHVTTKQSVTELEGKLSTMTTDRDAQKALAEEYGVKQGGEGVTNAPKAGGDQITSPEAAATEPWNDPNMEFNKSSDGSWV